MKKIILSEKQEDKLIQQIIFEESGYLDKILLVKNYLDDHFVRKSYTEMGGDTPSEKGVVAWVNDAGEAVKLFYDWQLFDFLQEKYKDLLPDKTERDKLLNDIITAWYYQKIDKNGVILKN